ncbi:hypothetical protein L1049_011697 [Liquidambar formosana]|uniref:Uncharacterized protein n=1 Tax=Liquidambar formosana TaxID=63359 RepID=A0AAP0RSE7_LIQFO
MNNSVSDHSFYVESEDDDEEKVYNKEEADGHDSDSSAEIQQEIKPSSYNTSWPQSYSFMNFSAFS